MLHPFLLEFGTEDGIDRSDELRQNIAEEPRSQNTVMSRKIISPDLGIVVGDYSLLCPTEVLGGGTQKCGNASPCHHKKELTRRHNIQLCHQRIGLLFFLASASYAEVHFRTTQLDQPLGALTHRKWLDRYIGTSMNLSMH